LAFANQHVKAEQNGGSRIDRHRRADVFELDAVEQDFHIRKRIDSDANTAHLTGREWMVGIHAHLRWKIERHRKTGDPLRKKELVAPVALLRRPKPRILAHGPQPAPVHIGINAARKRKLAGLLGGGQSDLAASDVPRLQKGRKGKEAHHGA
jgi:hypothetical protein